MSDDSSDQPPECSPKPPDQVRPGIRLSDLRQPPGAEAIACAEKAHEKLAASMQLNERIQRLMDPGGLSSIAKIGRQLEGQQKLINSFTRPAYLDAMSTMARAAALPVHEPLRIPEIHIPPNPIHETNRRLATIEERFEKMQEIAAQGAEIATSLQLSAAEFLTAFNDVATKNDRTAGRALRIAVIAAILATILPIAQTLYTEIWKAPGDATEMQKVVKDLKSELGVLRDAQQQSVDRLGEIIAKSNGDIAATLRDVRDNLGKNTAKSDQEMSSIVTQP